MWLGPFPDRIRGQDGFAFRVEYRIEARELGDDPPRTQEVRCASAVRSIVESVLAHCEVLRPEAAEQDVNLALQWQLPIKGSGFVVTRAAVNVLVDHDTVEAAEQLDAGRLAKKAEDIERRRLRARMAFLEEEVCRDQASLKLFLLADRIGQEKSAPRVSAAELEELATAVGQRSAKNRWVETAKILHKHIDSLPADAVLALVSTLRDSIRDHDNPVLLDRFDAVHAIEESGSAANDTRKSPDTARAQTRG